MERRRLLVRKDQTDVHIICNIYATSTTSNTYLFKSSSGIIDKLSAMWIDGVKLAEPVVSYKFSTKGNHEIKYSVVDNVVFDSNEFYSNNTSIRITSKFTTPITTNPWTPQSLIVESIIVDDSNPIYDSRNNCNAIIETTTNKLVTGSRYATTIPNTIKIIGSRAFCDVGLPSITIPNGVTTIEEFAFSTNNVLNNVTIPNSVTTIGDYAFAFCDSNMTSVTIPSSVISISGNPWLGNDSITNIVVNSNNTIYDSRDNCNAIIRKSDNALISGCQNTIIPSTIKIIGKYSFRNIDTLTTITIPSGVTTIEESAFLNCTGLTSITIPNSVKTIGALAFYGCHNVTDIVIGTGVTSIGASAFDINNLSSVTINRTTPPTAGSSIFGSNSKNFTIYVPSSSVSSYKTKSGWSSYASKILAIS